MKKVITLTVVLPIFLADAGFRSDTERVSKLDFPLTLVAEIYI